MKRNYQKPKVIKIKFDRPQVVTGECNYMSGHPSWGYACGACSPNCVRWSAQ